MLHAEERGEGPLVVLVHGSMDRCSGMRKAAGHLSDRACVVVYDRRGYGRSRDVGGPFEMACQVADLLEVLAGRPAAVVGHSYGGLVALAAAQAAPEVVLAVGAYESPQPWLDWWPAGSAGGASVALARREGPEAAAEAFLERMLGPELWGRLPERTRHERRAEGAALVGELADIRRHVPFDPAHIVVPAVLGYGERGAPHHHRGMRELATHLPGADLVVLPGVGHGVHLAAPHTWAAFAELVLARLPGRPAAPPATA